MDRKEMTIREVLEITMKNLKGITIPVELCETVGQQIMASARNIEICIEAMDKAAGGEEDGPVADPE